MKYENRKGFTLVELLAVIAILAILVILALPNVMNMYNKAQKETFLTEAKKVYSEAEKKFISNSISDKPTKVINSEDNTKLDMTGEKLQYCVILDNKGKVTSMKVSNGKWIASLDNGKTVDDLSIDDLEDGSLDGYKCSSKSVNSPEAIYCTFDGDMVQGAEYINGQYTYRYKQEGAHGERGAFTWQNIDLDGWGARVNVSSGDVTSKLCTYINGKPLVSTSVMIYGNSISSIDLSTSNTSTIVNMHSMFEIKDSDDLKINFGNFDTSNVTDMGGMFFFNTSNIDLSSFDTSKVTDMSEMFRYYKGKELDVSKFNTNKVTDMSGMFSNSRVNSFDLSNFDTGNVTDMSSMFSGSQVDSLDLSSFDTSKVTNMYDMFGYSNATIIDVSSFDTSKATNLSQMFSSCSKLKTIYASDKFVTTNANNSAYMFKDSINLVGGSKTAYDSNNVDKAYARIDAGSSNPGYFTKK